MPAPPCASCGKARAALRRPRSGQALCGACFCATFEAEVLRTVLAGRLLPPGAVVAVGASGGKDSTVLAHVLRALAPRLGLTLHLVAVDEGIGGYRDAALAAVRRQAARWELPLTIVAYADLFGGWTMDAVARSTAGSGRSRSCCTFCGVLRRRALEEGARRVGATHIVTGHNADDMAETVLMNFLRGDAARLARGGGLGSRGEGGALPRCRPLQLASQKEVVLYAHFRRLDYFSEECVYAPEAFRGHARDLLKRLEAARPSVVLDLVHSAERLALAPAARPPRPGACSRCGALASRALCQACALLDGLNRGRPRLAIGKGRRGLDEEGARGPPGDAEGGVEGAQGAPRECEGGVEGAKGALGDAEGGVEGAQGAPRECEGGVEGAKGALGDAEGGVEGAQGAPQERQGHVERDVEGAQGALGDAEGGVEGAQGAPRECEGDVEGAEGALGDAEEGVEGAQGAPRERQGDVERDVEGAQGALGDAEGVVEGAQGAPQERQGHVERDVQGAQGVPGEAEGGVEGAPSSCDCGAFGVGAACDCE